MKSFAQLHDRAHPLVIPNAWDAVSARLFEAMGFPAIATTSAGVAWSLGYADGEKLDVDELVASVARIGRCVTCHLSVDLEAGFSPETSHVVALAERVLEAGACAINLEDWDVTADAPYPLAIATERIDALKRKFGNLLFVNARTDILLQQHGEEAMRVDAVIERLKAFENVGADCVFVPGVWDEETIAKLAATTSLPLNVLANAKSPSVARLGELGVARVSVGSGPVLHAMYQTQAVARELLDHGTFSYLLMPDMISYAEMNALFTK